MEKVNKKLLKLCSFYVSDWHLITMMIPYLNEEINKENKIVTILEKDIKDKVETLVQKLNLKNSEKILNIEWNVIKTKKYAEIKNLINKESKMSKRITIIVNGSKKFIDTVNKNIEKWIKQDKNLQNIKLINCYEITEFNYNINEILDEHDKILNTSGERKIEDVFEGYEKNKKIV